MLKEVKNKKGEVVGKYYEFDDIKVGINETKVYDANGNEIVKKVELTEDDILQLALSKLNINTRNYVAGMAREGKPSKTRIKNTLLAKLGIDDSELTEDNIDTLLEKAKRAISSKK